MLFRIMEQLNTTNVRLNNIEAQRNQPTGDQTGVEQEEHPQVNIGENPEVHQVNLALHPMYEWAREAFGVNNEPCDSVGHITKKIRIDVLDFERMVNPTIFSAWLVTIEEYFDWYLMCDE